MIGIFCDHVAPPDFARRVWIFCIIFEWKISVLLADFYSIHVQSANHKKESGWTDSLNI